MLSAYVLIQTEVGKAGQAAQAIRGINGVPSGVGHRVVKGGGRGARPTVTD
jgi:hypothetical protein